LPQTNPPPHCALFGATVQNPLSELDPKLEAEFFACFAPYYDRERPGASKAAKLDLSLQRMLPLAALAGYPETKLRLIHVAGTKGKGSTCFFLAALLNSANYRCGIFTSPHLLTVRERFQINNQLIDYAQLLSCARDFAAALAASKLQPTLFEIMTVLSLAYFAHSQCDFAIIETGIGGRLDATNYISAPECTVITPISFDHMDILGNSISAIAGEKAGIIKPGVPVVSAPQVFTEAVEVISATATARSARLVDSISCEQCRQQQWPIASLPRFQQQNFATALTACQTLGIAADPTHLTMPALRGRCQCLQTQPLVVIDAAHNGDSARQLAAALAELYAQVQFTTVLGIADGKDADAIVRELLPITRQFILTDPRQPKQSGLQHLLASTERYAIPVKVQPNLQTAAELPPTPLLFTGSFFTAIIGLELFAANLSESCIRPEY